MGLLPDWMIEREVKIEPFSPQMERPGVISYGVTSYGYDVRAGYKWKLFDVLAGGVVDPKNFDPRLLREVDLTPPDDHDWFNTNIADPTCNRCGVYRSNVHSDSWLEKCRALTPNFITIPPNSYVLGESLETFTIPRDMGVICIGKSTYARCGIIVNVTPGEPEWTGKWTIEISNSSPLPAKVYCGEGIMQCMFIRSDGERDLSNRALHYFMERVSKGCQTGPVHIPGVAANAYDQLRLGFKQTTCRVSYADKKGKYQNQGGIKLPEVKK